MTLEIANDPIVKTICEAEDISSVLESMYQSCQEVGADKFSYHFTPAFESQTSTRVEVFSVGLPRTWVALYGRKSVRNADPIPETIMRKGRVMTWGDAVSDAELDEDEQKFVRATKNLGLEYGIGIPLWGPGNRHAYAGLGFPEPVDVERNCEIAAEHMVLQAGHQRICELIAVETPTKLSKRETEILTWIARGKSNPDIGTILSIAPETVATYVSRIYDKIGTRDRVGAAIRGLQIGLITL